METMQQKNERNARVQARYDELMREGKHGHYETMFRLVREEVERERERLARDVAGLHMAQSVNNQNHPGAWHDGVDAALAVIRGA